MPFLAPLIPLIAPVVGAAAGKLFGGSPGGTSSSQSNTLAAQNLANAKQASDLATQTSGTGLGLVNNASDTLNQPKSYFQSILNGDRANTTQTLAPQIAQIQQALQQALTTGSTLNARGGGRASTLAALPSQATTQINNLYDTARPQAATSLAQIGGQLGSLGTGVLGNSSSFLGASNSSNLGGMANDLLRNQQSFDQSSKLGNSIGGILKGVNWGNIFKGGSGSPAPLPVGGSRMPASWGVTGVDGL